jgi:flagellar M-ring protein FliF
MQISTEFKKLRSSFANLGPARLALLGVVLFAVIGAVAGGSLYLSSAQMIPLYSGLGQRDVGSISAQLADANIPFDVNAQQTTILVRPTDQSRARVLLAKVGLPANSAAGYELFDNLGSLGLTSFMQEVTRLRALEGEIGRTIQALDGVDAVRVHLVLPQPSLLRRNSQDPSASVVLRLGPGWRAEATEAVRNIVSAAVPGMKIEQVSVASSDGRVLAAGGDANSLVSSSLSTLRSRLAREYEERTARTLAPVLGGSNFRISAAIDVDIDRRREAETVFDPESKVERSTRVVRQVNESQNRSGETAVGVDANIPEEVTDTKSGENSTKKDEKREETINFEINSRRVETERQGYRIKRVALAVIVNRDQLVKAIGTGATEAQIAERLEMLTRLIKAAAGYLETRGDTIEVSAIAFDPSAVLEPAPELSLLNQIAMNSGILLSTVVFIGGILLLIMFGIRPAVRALAKPEQEPIALQAGDLPIGDNMAAIGGDATEGSPMAGVGFADNSAGITFGSDDVQDDQPQSARDKLLTLVENRETEVSTVMRDWLNEDERAA